MTTPLQDLELVEKIILETRSRPCIVLSTGGCGILTEAMVWRDGSGGGHDPNYMGARSFALAFAHRVVGAIGASTFSTPQLLVDTATALNNGLTHVSLECTTWQYESDGVEICSVGANSVLVFEENVVREAIIPHSVNAFLQSQGKSPISDVRGRLATHALGGKKGCKVDDVRIAHVPLLPTTTLAIIKDRRLADNIIQQAVPRNDLPSFVEAWDPPGKRIRTSVLISL